MAGTNNQPFLITLALLCCVGLINSQILPGQVCLAAATFFRSQGCLDEPTPLCRVLAFTLLFSLRGEPLCNQRPCEGYNQSPVSTCSNIFGCPAPRIDTSGICSGLQVCCTNEVAITAPPTTTPAATPPAAP